VAIAHSAGSERVVRRNALAWCSFSTAMERAAQTLAAHDFGVVVVEDFTDTVRRHEAVEFRWAPRLRLFPAAQALLTVRPHAPQGSELQLSIAYVPPFHAFGNFFDGLLGRHIAWLTAGVLLGRLREAIHEYPSQKKGQRKEALWHSQPPREPH
jgi:hypothetical protein